MPISKVVSIVQDGTWQGQRGLMHNQNVTLEDGMVGQASSVNAVPPYQPGDEVEYTLTGGEYNGIPKLSIKKAGAGNFGGGSGGGGGGRPSGGGGSKGGSYDATGQMVGSCMGIAGRLLANGVIKATHQVGVSATIEACADALCQASLRLKAKHTPAPVQQAPAQQAYTPPAAAAAPAGQPVQQAVQTATGRMAPAQPAQQAQAPQAPAAPAAGYVEDDEDIPF